METLTVMTGNKAKAAAPKASVTKAIERYQKKFAKVTNRRCVSENWLLCTLEHEGKFWLRDEHSLIGLSFRPPTNPGLSTTPYESEVKEYTRLVSRFVDEISKSTKELAPLDLGRLKIARQQDKIISYDDAYLAYNPKYLQLIVDILGGKDIRYVEIGAYLFLHSWNKGLEDCAILMAITLPPTPPKK